MRAFPTRVIVFCVTTVVLCAAAAAQVAAGPPAVGFITAAYRSINETTEVQGRIQSPQRVDLVARVTAFLNERLFVEGTEVKTGNVLYRLERPPFEADVEAKQAAVAQAQAQLDNANVALSRARDLFEKNAGTQAAFDDATATQRTAAAQLQAARAALHQSQINLDYTNIAAPIDGRIGRTSVTIGNVVSPTSGVLATIVSEDPMYVAFPVSVRRALELRDRYAAQGFDAVQIRLRLSNRKVYDQIGKLDFVDIGIAKETDTIVFRGTIANPLMPNGSGLRELTDGQFVTVLLEAVEPTQVLAVPRAALLADQQGQYVYIVNDQNIAEQRRVKLGESTPDTASVVDGLKPGDRVITEGIQRVRPNQPVAPAPAAPMRPEGTP
jgi:membrane fusion protein, multidrug efflux system